MDIERIKIVGFKSFVDPVEIEIPAGLTGIVGPNGCGKSNLIESLRWVMGENSSRSMRASSMDDVIFSGSQKRPPRSHGEVTVTIDNHDIADLNFIDDKIKQEPTIEITRRITRDSGSTYLLNGREVRARDIQLLFADASTGAKASALVKQGQINELINARPVDRRNLLEEAAGICGLHNRRREAELKLQAAQQNLARLDDVLLEIDKRIAVLAEQAGHARSYRELAAAIREKEIIIYYLRWQELDKRLIDARHQVEKAKELESRQTQEHSEAIKQQIIARNNLPTMRRKHADYKSSLQRLEHELEQKKIQSANLDNKKKELAIYIDQLKSDIAGANAVLRDQDDAIGSIIDEQKRLRDQIEREKSSWRELEQSLVAANKTIASSESRIAAKAEIMTAIKVKSELALKAKDEITGKIEKLNNELAVVDRDTAKCKSEATKADKDMTAARQQLRQSQGHIKQLEAASKKIEARYNDSKAVLDDSLKAKFEAREGVDLLQGQADALNKIIDEQDFKWRPLINLITIDPGYEYALGAALGDDLLAGTGDSDPICWHERALTSDLPPLANGATALLNHVKAPECLRARLSQIAVVSDDKQAQAILPLLQCGQRIVSKEGALWRWDGYEAKAKVAGTANSLRLANKNKLAVITGNLMKAKARLEEATRLADEAKNQFDTSKEAYEQHNLQYNSCKQDIINIDLTIARADNERNKAQQQLQNLATTEKQLNQAIATSVRGLEEARQELVNGDSVGGLESELAAMKAELGEQRAAATEAQAAINSFTRERELRLERLEAINSEQIKWRTRSAKAADHRHELEQRLAVVEKQYNEIVANPDHIADQIDQLQQKIIAARNQLEQKGSTLAEAEKISLDADAKVQEVMSLIAGIREDKVKFATIIDNTSEQRQNLEDEITDKFCRDGSTVEQFLVKAANKQEAKQKNQQPTEKPVKKYSITALENDLERLALKRDQLGSVNLRADIELDEDKKRLQAMQSEHDDLIEAINKLRNAINTLNKEGRERLIDAFARVNDNFGRLFGTLFSGGVANLDLIEADDPLNAGLEIIANPPGKKPRSISLLSGGEQALTCIALIFAVFITNPAPICILDEVDAALDDANVERFCNMLDEVCRSTGARFLVATHNPLTMARMNNLYGVTMIEKGVSRVLSVNLDTAASYSEAV